jgi:hypothetical protein
VMNGHGEGRMFLSFVVLLYGVPLSP